MIRDLYYIDVELNYVPMILKIENLVLYKFNTKKEKRRENLLIISFDIYQVQVGINRLVTSV